MPEKKFELGDYVEVKDRIAIFYELYPQGRLWTKQIQLSSEPDGVPRIIVEACAFRTPDDPIPGVGWSWMVLPGKTPYTAGSELENTETSAWGRAIAATGILIDRSIASAQEVANKAHAPAGGTATASDGAETPRKAPDVETEELLADTPRRSGMVRLGSANGYKLEARQGPDGHVVGFRFETDKGEVPQVVVEGPAGEALFLATGMNPGVLRDTRITVKGRLYNVKRPGKRGFPRLHVTEWEYDVWKYPADLEPPLAEPPEDVELVGEAEAETAPLGLVS